MHVSIYACMYVHAVHAYICIHEHEYRWLLKHACKGWNAKLLCPRSAIMGLFYPNSRPLLPL